MTGRERANFVNTARNQRTKSTSSEVKKLVFSTHSARADVHFSCFKLEYEFLRSVVFMYLEFMECHTRIVDRPWLLCKHSVWECYGKFRKLPSPTVPHPATLRLPCYGQASEPASRWLLPSPAHRLPSLVRAWTITPRARPTAGPWAANSAGSSPRIL